MPPRSFDYEYVQEGNSWIVQSNIDPSVLPAPVSIKDSYLQVLFYSVQKVRAYLKLVVKQIRHICARSNTHIFS